MMKYLFYLFSLSFLITFLSGCSDNDNDNDSNECGCEESVTEISGKWKLEKSMVYFPGSIKDYSKYNITIEIKSDELLIVHKYTPQEGLYFFEPNKYSITNKNNYYTATLDGSTYDIYILENKLIVDLSPVDGPRYYFCCIKD